MPIDSYRILADPNISLPAEGRKEETNILLEYSSDMKKARLHSTLVALLNDPVLADIPKNPTLTDVDTLISLELGSAMRISVLKLDGSSFGTYVSVFLVANFVPGFNEQE